MVHAQSPQTQSNFRYVPLTISKYQYQKSPVQPPSPSPVRCANVQQDCFQGMLNIPIIFKCPPMSIPCQNPPPCLKRNNIIITSQPLNGITIIIASSSSACQLNRKVDTRLLPLHKKHKNHNLFHFEIPSRMDLTINHYHHVNRTEKLTHDPPSITHTTPNMGPYLFPALL